MPRRRRMPLLVTGGEAAQWNMLPTRPLQPVFAPGTGLGEFRCNPQSLASPRVPQNPAKCLQMLSLTPTQQCTLLILRMIPKNRAVAFVQAKKANWKPHKQELGVQVAPCHQCPRQHLQNSHCHRIGPCDHLEKSHPSTSEESGRWPANQEMKLPPASSTKGTAKMPRAENQICEVCAPIHAKACG